jgi:hypothetical protein
MRTIYEESRTVADNASGSFHSLVPPTSRNKSPVAQPRSAFKMQPEIGQSQHLQYAVDGVEHRFESHSGKHGELPKVGCQEAIAERIETNMLSAPISSRNPVRSSMV